MEFLYDLVIMLCLIFLYLITPRRLNRKIKDRIKKYGLTHITKASNVKFIMDEDGYANFKASSRIRGFANFFRKSVFFFLGKPNKWSYFYNIGFSNRRNLVMLKILPENIDEILFEKCRYRKFDRVIIHLGDIRLKAEVFELKRDKELA